MHTAPALGTVSKVFTVCWHKWCYIRVTIPNFLFVFPPAKEGSSGLWNILTNNIWGGILKVHRPKYTLEFSLYFCPVLSSIPVHYGRSPELPQFSVAFGTHNEKTNIHTRGGKYQGFQTFQSPPSRQCWVLYRRAEGPFSNDCLYCHHLKSEASTLGILYILKPSHKKTASLAHYL